MKRNLVRACTIAAVALAVAGLSARDADACGKKPWDTAVLLSNGAVVSVQDVPATAAASANKQDGPSQASVVGMWIVTFYVDGKQWDFAIEQFHADGTEMTNDIYAPAVGNVCWGVWEPTAGNNSFRLKHTGVTFDNNGYAGLFDLSATIVVSPNGDSFSGKFVADQEDVAGNILPSFHVTGVLRAKRFKFDPPHHS